MRSTAIRIRPTGGGLYLADVDVPTDDGAGNFVTSATGPDGAAALDRAAAIAQHIMDDPVMSALIPPQAHAAVAGAKLLAQAAHAGEDILSSLWSKLKGPGKKRLAKVLLETTHGDHRSDLGGGIVVGPGRGARGGSSGKRTNIPSGGRPGFHWVSSPPPGHWEKDRAAAPTDPYGGYGPPQLPPGWTYDPYGNPMPPGAGYNPYDPYGAGAYGGYMPYPGMPYGGPPFMPYDPWQQYQQYGGYGSYADDGFGGYAGGYQDAIMQDQQALEQLFAQGGSY